MSILAVGSVAFDTIRTPFGEAKDIVGGSLTYFALAASQFTDVNLVAVVGEDFSEKHMAVFANKRIDLQGLQRAPGKTFRWGGEYSYNLNDRETLFTELNVFESFQPKLPPSYRQADIVFLGNMHPSLQLSVLEQVESKRLVGMDSMNLWIETTPSELREVLRHVDILKIDDSEARQLADEYNLRKAAAKIHAMGPKTLVATRGSHGSMLIADDELFVAPAYPLEDEQDPTGAGDSFAGGFFGYLAQQASLDNGVLRQAMIFGNAMGSLCVEDFGTKRLQRLTHDEILDRYRSLKRLTHFEDL
ncbi:MAG TPA: PfkB family carbohydrate kinase [Dehalococcoidia bacterium]